MHFSLLGKVLCNRYFEHLTIGGSPSFVLIFFLIDQKETPTAEILWIAERIFLFDVTINIPVLFLFVRFCLYKK